MQRDFGGIKSHTAAGTEANRVGMNALVIVEPEGGLVAARIVLHESQLRPSHRTVVPFFGRTLLSESHAGRRQHTGLHDQLTSINFHD